MVLFLNEHLTKDVLQETLFKPNDPLITNEKGTKPYILQHLNNIKLLRSQFIATFVNMLLCEPHSVVVSMQHCYYADKLGLIPEPG